MSMILGVWDGVKEPLLGDGRGMEDAVLAGKWPSKALIQILC